MAKKTEGVRILVQDVLRTISTPYSEDIIKDVCFKIEKNLDWYKRYQDLGVELNNEWVVNNWLGKYTKELTGMKNLRQVELKDKHIITSYTKLSR